MFSIIFLFFLSSCGGSGGSGGGGSKASAATGVRILHGVLDVAPLNVLSTSRPDQVVQLASFAEPSVYAALPDGLQEISLTLNKSPSTVYARFNVDIQRNDHYSLVFYGNPDNLGLNVSLIKDEAGVIPEGTAAVKIIHALVGAGLLQASFSDGQSSGQTMFGAAANYAYVPQGLNGIIIRRVSDGRAVANISHEFAAGRSYSIFVSGEVDYFVVSRVLQD